MYRRLQEFVISTNSNIIDTSVIINWKSNDGDLLQWDAYTQANRSTMIFDNKVELKHKEDAKLLELLNLSYKLD